MRMMLNMLRLECKKAIKNKFFLFAILIGVAITFFSLIPELQSYYKDTNNFIKYSARYSVTYNPLTPMETLFNHWIGGEAYTIGSVGYFFIFPLLIAIPYGWSYCAERRNGYIRNMVIRSGRLRYYVSKYVAVFVSGGLAMVIPLAFNFLLTAMFVPAILPVADISYSAYYAVGGTSPMSMLFFSHPFLYVFLYLLVDFVFCGLISCLCYALAFFIKSRVAVVLLPFFILLAFRYFCGSFIYTSPNTVRYTELSPMFFLRPAQAELTASWPVIIIEAAVLLLFTFYMTVVRGRRHEIY